MKSNTRLSHKTILMIALGGVMIALEIVLERSGYSSNNNRYSLAFIARIITGSLFGPLFSACIGGAADFIGAAIIYGAPNPFLTITAVLRGFCYGIFLKDKITVKRTVYAVLSVEIICTLLVNTFILNNLYGDGSMLQYWGRFIGRVPQAVIYIVVQIPVIMLLSKSLIPALRGIVRGYEETGKVTETVNSVITPGSHPGLERVREFANLIGNPERNLRIVHVAGTNGKGSVSNMIAAVLVHSGRKVGIFNSPYLYSPKEYFNINGKLASDSVYAGLTARLTDIIKKKSEKDPEFKAPTEFEFYTCAALKYFSDSGCDVVIMEAGMGGREDATNFIQAPELSVITNIGIDHTAFLGNTLAEIAEHKAGIIKRGSAVALYPSSPEAVEVLVKKCTENRIEPVIADFSKLATHLLNTGEMLNEVRYETANGKQYSVLLRNPATYMARNAALALEAIEKLKERGFYITDDNVKEGMLGLLMPARFEILRTNPLIIADGAHNPQCFEAVKEAIEPILDGKQAVVLTAVMRDKDYNKMYGILDPLAKAYVAVSANNTRSMPARELAEILAGYGKPVEEADSIKEGVRKALELAGDGVVLITGSLYMMNEVRRTLLR